MPFDLPRLWKLMASWRLKTPLTWPLTTGWLILWLRWKPMALSPWKVFANEAVGWPILGVLQRNLRVMISLGGQACIEKYHLYFVTWFYYDFMTWRLLILVLFGLPPSVPSISTIFGLCFAMQLARGRRCCGNNASKKVSHLSHACW